MLLAVPCFCREDENILKYYYIPFQVETYEAVTIENIKSKAEIKGELAKDNASKLLRLLAERKQGSVFDRKRVRLLVETLEGKNPVYVDTSATVLMSQEQYALNPSAFIALKKLLSRLK